MELIGRLTSNAEIKQLKDERKFVIFTIEINDYYKQKGTDKGVKTTLFINCSYWISTAVCEKLTKASVVELTGRIFLNAYTGFDGEAKTTLCCYVNTIKIHHSSKHSDAKPNEEKQSLQDDLPF